MRWHEVSNVRNWNLMFLVVNLECGLGIYCTTTLDIYQLMVR
jgi:hypothetical protein